MPETTSAADSRSRRGVAITFFLGMLTPVMAAVTPASSLVTSLAGAILIGLALNALCWGLYRAVLRSRAASIWHASILPLHGRWLCYLVCGVLAALGIAASFAVASGLVWLLAVALLRTR